jgi:hypothetical protein
VVLQQCQKQQHLKATTMMNKRILIEVQQKKERVATRSFPEKEWMKRRGGKKPSLCKNN